MKRKWFFKFLTKWGKQILVMNLQFDGFISTMKTLHYEEKIVIFRYFVFQASMVIDMIWFLYLYLSYVRFT